MSVLLSPIVGLEDLAWWTVQNRGGWGYAGESDKVQVSKCFFLAFEWFAFGHSDADDARHTCWLSCGVEYLYGIKVDGVIKCFSSEPVFHCRHLDWTALDCSSYCTVGYRHFLRHD